MNQSDTPNTDDDGDAGPESWPYPFGLSSRATFVLIVLVGLIGTGLVVSLFESADQSLLGDLVWILGYGTTVFVVWYIWIRPLDIVGDAGRERVSRDEEENEPPEANGADASDGSPTAPDTTNAEETTTEEGDPQQNDPPGDTERTETR